MERRDFLKLAGSAFLGAGLLGGLGSSAWAAVAEAAAAASPVPAARAKAVIQIWMWGGPAHLDTFDPKPDAGYDYCGTLNHPIATNVPGVQICELLPLLAQQADKYSIIRSMTHGNNAHETASYWMQTGHKPGGDVVYPSVGAVTSLFKGVDHGYSGQIPPYVVMTQPQGRFSPEGCLGLRYAPFVTGGDPNQQRFAVEGIVAEGITDQRQQSRRELMHSLDTLGEDLPSNPRFQQLDACEAKAYDLILGNGGKLFDLSQEDAALRDRYGRSTFGQSCLAARRLVEQGVPYVCINYPGWDTHKQNFQIMQRKLPEMDKGMATLLQDLTDRKLLDSTVVWWGGEFGRTPKIDWDAPWNGGRGHWGSCFCHVLAGGGFKGGQVVGASDAKGEQVAQRAVYPQDLIGSILELLGIDPDGSLPNSRGLTLTVMPPSESGPGKGRLTEIM